MNPKDLPQSSTSDVSTGGAQGLVARIKATNPSYLAAAGVVLVVALWMLSGVFGGSDDAAIAPAPGGGAADGGLMPRVRVTTLTSQVHTPVISLMGRTQAGQAVSVRAEIPGRVAEVVAVKGQSVAAGDVLVRIDAEDRAQRLSEAKARLKQTQIAFESAKKLSKGGYSSQLNVAQAEADLAASRALVTRMERELANTEIRAPFAGVVDTLPVEVGDYLDKAGQPVARVLDLTTIKAIGQVSERDVSQIEEGASARIILPGGRVLVGQVSYVGMSSNAMTRTFPVEVTARVPGANVPEGQTADIRLPLASIIAHNISPALLTLNEHGSIGVKTVNAEGKVQFHAVTIETDALDGTWLTGLPGQIRVITVGQEFVRVGESVQTVEGDLGTMQPELSGGADPLNGASNETAAEN